MSFGVEILGLEGFSEGGSIGAGSVEAGCGGADWVGDGSPGVDTVALTGATLDLATGAATLLLKLFNNCAAFLAESTVGLLLRRIVWLLGDAGLAGLMGGRAALDLRRARRGIVTF